MAGIQITVSERPAPSEDDARWEAATTVDGREHHAFGESPAEAVDTLLDYAPCRDLADADFDPARAAAPAPADQSPPGV